MPSSSRLLCIDPQSAVLLENAFFRTGFKNTKPSMANIFGEEIISRTKKVWGMDEEGEISGSYRPTGHPGVSLACCACFAPRRGSSLFAMLTALVRNRRLLQRASYVQAIGE